MKSKVYESTFQRTKSFVHTTSELGDIQILVRLHKQVQVGILIDPSTRIRGLAGLIPTTVYVTHRGYCGHSILGFFLRLPVSSHIGLACIDMYVSSASHAFSSLGSDKLGVRAGRVPGIPQVVSYIFLFMAGNEFLGVFPGELLAISLEQETNFSTDALRDALPISISPFRIAPAKLKDILDKSFNRTSASPSGTPMLFVRKKDDSL
ncbi:hypothetical protein MTR67_040032 [Solanum verrucosum]|uniref:Uncharacterized protein n=1 Tax=Solanum verrucosum TaxID=315347 RepID=A0AAF0UIH1_SOLVR|nr:hypothetical protein MTR67_040032 [Solanum verrucosum]